jgi:uncharacterized delta-60 repeat protein
MKKYALQFLISSIGLALATAAPNSLDTTFGAGTGKTATPVGSGNAYISDLKLTSDGKILAAGTSFNGTDFDFALGRYNTNGTVDTTFGLTPGRTITDFGGNDSIVGIAFHTTATSGVVAAGTTNNGTNNFIALARYNLNVNGVTDGSLDSAFGTAGTLSTDLGVASGVVVDGSQNILVSGTLSNDFVLYRYNSTGALDGTFGSGGKATADFGNAETSTCIALQTDGKILVAGYTYNSSTGYTDFALARFLVTGTLDPNFGTGGKVTTRILGFDKANGIVARSDGKIFLVGSSGSGAISYFGLVRYNADGTLDPTFGWSGKVLTSFGGFEIGYRVVLQPDGAILVAGSSSNGVNTDFALARYSSNGTLDNSFNSLKTHAHDSTGEVTTDFAGFNDEAHAMALLPDGRIVLGGFSIQGSGLEWFALARYSGGSLSPYTYDSSYGLRYYTGTSPFGGGSYESTELGTLSFFPYPWQNYAYSSRLQDYLYGDFTTGYLYGAQYGRLIANADGDQWYYSYCVGWIFVGNFAGTVYDGAVYSLRFGWIWPLGAGNFFYSSIYGWIKAYGNGYVFLCSYNRGTYYQ